MKAIAVLGILVIVALAAVYLVFSKPAYPMTKEDAQKFFIEDLADKYPDADVREVVEILPATAQDGASYYQLKARVTKGLSTPCPERMHVFYDYPPKNFVAQPPEYITRGCEVCLNEPNCILAFPEEAIIASHTYPGTEEIAQFIKSNTDAQASAELRDSYMNYTGVCVVTWRSPSLKATASAVLSKSSNQAIEVVLGREI